MIIRLSEQAEAHLEDIQIYSLSELGLIQAEHYLAEIQNIFELLLLHPKLGKPAEHIRMNYRMIGAGSHIIYYHVSCEFIDITAILHQRMNPFLHLDF